MRVCNCPDQLQRFKHYLAAGIGKTYQVLTFDDYAGDQAALDSCNRYMNLHKAYISSGVGMVFMGTQGTGKTMLPMLMMKFFVREGYNCFATTFTDMVVKITDSWFTAERDFKRKIDSAHVLLIDDLGKDVPRPGTRESALMDTILRERVQNSRPTFITTNLNLQAFQEAYGVSAMSLLRERSNVVVVQGGDFRNQALERSMQESKQGIVRPIR
jgi:DNA replication protein DnaC